MSLQFILLQAPVARVLTFFFQSISKCSHSLPLSKAAAAAAAVCAPVVQPSCLHTHGGQMSQSIPLDVQPKTCSSCLGMFAILPPSNQVIWRPDFRAGGKVTSGSENGFGRRAGSITINTAVGVGLHTDSWTSVCLCVKSSRQPHTHGVSNRPIREKTCRTEGTAQKQGWK